MTDNDLDLEVQALTLQLQQLKVEQERLERQLSRVQNKIRRWGRKSAEGKSQGAVKTSRTSPVQSHVPSQVFEQSQGRQITRNGLWVKEYTYSRIDAPEKGDHVRILNPKKGQCNIGIIIDFCNDGKVKILTDKNTIITRLPKNVHYYNKVLKCPPTIKTQDRSWTTMITRNQGLLEVYVIKSQSKNGRETTKTTITSQKRLVKWMGRCSNYSCNKRKRVNFRKPSISSKYTCLPITKKILST